MQIKLKELTLIPAAFLTFLIIMISMSLSEIEMQLLSYGTLAMVLGGFFCMSIMYLYEGEMSRYGMCNLLFMAIFVGITIVNGHDIKNAIYLTAETWLMLLIMQYYKHRMKMVIVCCALAFSFCVYCNAIHMLQNPHLWIVNEEKQLSGYLLGNNYNGMGIRMIIALTTNILCLKFSKLWLLNIIPLTVAIVLPLAVVQSMTSLSCILMLLLCCLIPSNKLKKAGLAGLFILFVLFQVFVVFNGKGLENNELAVYFIEDVLDKDITFTNRTHMWDSALRVIAESPIIGYGYVDDAWFRANMTNFAMGPHNFILSLFIYGGIGHFLLYIIICFMAYRSISQCKDTMSIVLQFAIVTMMVMMLMEMYPYPLVMYMIALAYYYPYIEEQVNAGKQEGIEEEGIQNPVPLPFTTETRTET